MRTIKGPTQKTNKFILFASTYLDRITFRQHLFTSFFIRLVFVVYGEFQDYYAEVPFTDIDYRVVTDGARYILNEQSPYKRHTYRYTPLLAFLLTGNIFIHASFGKILFSIFDILIGIIIRQIILDEYLHTFEAIENSFLKRNKRILDSSSQSRFHPIPMRYQKRATWASLLWLYNPMAVIIATRGNGDSITSLFILLTIFALHRSVTHSKAYSFVLLAGVCHGLAIHFRLYPLVFSLAYHLYLGKLDPININQRSKYILTVIFQFNRKQILFIFTTLSTLIGLTLYFYHNYGYEFLYESYLYHLLRKDTRHNFSLYFYMNLLNDKPILVEKIFTFLPQLLVLLTINANFGIHRKTIGFCIFLQSFLVVTFNPVITSQYFIWYLAILPICLKNLRLLKINVALSYCGLWCLVQAIWLFSAYLLEFKGWNTFGFIYIGSVIFFATNCFIMKVLIEICTPVIM